MAIESVMKHSTLGPYTEVSQLRFDDDLEEEIIFYDQRLRGIGYDAAKATARKARDAKERERMSRRRGGAEEYDMFDKLRKNTKVNLEEWKRKTAPGTVDDAFDHISNFDWDGPYTAKLQEEFDRTLVDDIKETERAYREMQSWLKANPTKNHGDWLAYHMKQRGGRSKKRHGERPIINSEDIKRNGLTWAMVDKFAPTDTPAIYNTDTSKGPGIHWCVAFIKDGKGYIYDPLGPQNHRVTTGDGDSDPFIRAAFKKKGVKIIHFYPYPSQMRSNSLCGWHSIYIATLLRDYLRQYPDATEDELDEVIETQFGKRATQDDIDLLQYAFTPSKH